MNEAFSAEERELLGRPDWAICVATFYEDLAERLINGAIEGFDAGGVSAASVHTYEVPGPSSFRSLRRHARNPGATRASPASVS